MTFQPELRFVTHRNHYLFSDYYLTHRAAERQEWQSLDAQPSMDALRQLWQAQQAAVRHDVEGLRLAHLGGRRVELQALLKQRSPANGWSGWQNEDDGKSILRTWTPVYRFDLDPAEARFYTHALPVLAQFNHAGPFPGGKTKTTMQKLQAVKLPVFDPGLDLAPLEELHAELAAVRTQIERTDRLIDQVVYRLYGLTEEEIAVVEGSA